MYNTYYCIHKYQVFYILTFSLVSKRITIDFLFIKVIGKRIGYTGARTYDSVPHYNRPGAAALTNVALRSLDRDSNWLIHSKDYE